MDNLFEIAREGNEDEFIKACEENIASVTMRNEDGNLLHMAARSRILLPTVRKIISDLEGKIEKAEKAKEWGESKRLK